VLPARYTLIVPHQRATSGGVYVIEQLARHLSRSAEVTLAVRAGPTRPIAGVRVLGAPNLNAHELPDADVVLGGLAQPDPERVLALPAGKGALLFLLQGYGVPGNPRVSAMLERRPRVLAVSSFLAERAREHGCEVEQVAPGLDRSIFHAGPPSEKRKPVVAMLAHTIGWKATDDGLAALAQVRAAIPEVELVLFGTAAPDAEASGGSRTRTPTEPGAESNGDSRATAQTEPSTEPSTEPGSEPRARFLGTLARSQVAELLRRASVFVCSSQEEGLGLPGIEALACGAALASTDTKGGRDYAIDSQTALVSTPGRPDLLAESVIRLLREPQLRARLSRQGQERVLSTYPPWPQAAELFGQAVTRLLDRAPATAPAVR
jgi:glycosyltransferase involved in cell wall biosynthesis